MNTLRLDRNRCLEHFFAVSREHLGTRFDELLDELRIPPRDRPSEIPVTALVSLLNALNVTLDSVMSGAVDLKTMALQLQGKRCAFPDRYAATLPYSSRFTGFYMLDYVTRYFGEATARILRQRLQLRNEHFDDVSQKNNILLPLDLTNYVHEYFGDDYVKDMGKNSISHYRKSRHGLELAAMADVPGMLERFFVEFAPTTVEKNYEWTVRRVSTHAVLLRGKPRGEVFEAFRTRITANRSLEILRKGFFTELPSLIPGHRGSCLQLKSISAGDGHDLYQISFARTASASKADDLH
jgi:hypothetical protein